MHVVRRGRARAQCFFSDHDRSAFLGAMGKYAAHFECAIHAYALMGNHVHLLLSASGGGGATPLLASVCDEHLRSIGEAHTGENVQWEHDCEASTIHVRRHLLACMRYIELNPVRAGLVRHPGDYRWSSYAANALGRDNALVSPHAFYYALGRSSAERCYAYQRLFGAPANPPARTPGGPHTGPRGRFRPT